MKKPITITLDEEDLKYLNIFADKHFEGNLSMTLRYIITDHKKYTMENEKK